MLHANFSLSVLSLDDYFPLLAAAPAQQGDFHPPAGFENLFNGKDLGGWRGRQQDYSPYAEAKLSSDEKSAKQRQWNDDLARHWHVDAASGEIVSDGKGVYLTTDKDYRDFEFTLDWLMVSHNGDSGVYLRGYPQVQIWDPENPHEVKNGAPKGSGGLWNDNNDNAGKWPLVKADKPIGQWNTMRIKMIGSRVWVWFNDQLTVDGQVLDNYFDRSRTILPRGPIELQTHGSELRFRNLYVREISSAEANQTLRKLVGDDGYKSVFNGKDFTGWGGQIDQYEVKDGAIFCKPKQGGNVYTLEDYSDFEARLEFVAAGWKQWPLHPLPGRGGHRLRRHVRIADPRRHRRPIQDARSAAILLLRLWRGRRPERLSASARRLEFRACDHQGPHHQGRTQWQRRRGHRCLQNRAAVHARQGPSWPDALKGSFGFAGHDDPVGFRDIWIKPLN